MKRLFAYLLKKKTEKQRKLIAQMATPAARTY